MQLKDEVASNMCGFSGLQIVHGSRRYRGALKVSRMRASDMGGPTARTLATYYRKDSSNIYLS